MTQRETPQHTGRNFTRRLLLAAGFITAAVAAFVLYAMKAHNGKDVAGAVACPGAEAKAAAMRPLAHGEVAAFSVADEPRPLTELKFVDGQGAPARLADFKGRTVLLNLWATWCVPCRQEMPALDRLEARLGGPDFTVVAVNIDTAKLDRPKAFLQEVAVKNLGFYADPTADIFETLKGAGDALGLPTTVLVDKNGCGLGVMAGPAQWDSPDALALIAAARGEPSNAAGRPAP